MRSLVYILSVSVLLLAACLRTGAREIRTGAFFSPDGLGLSLQFDNDWGDEIRCVNLYADMYGVYSGRTSEAGFVASYTHSYILKVYDFEYSRLSMYAGAGFLGGYVHDYESGMFSTTDRALRHGRGLVAALACDLGLAFDFDRRVTVDLSLCLAPGLHFRRDADSGTTIISAYRRGFISALLPRICIYYRF